MECKYCRMLFILLSAITLNIVNGQSRSDYQIPQPTAVVLSRGFRISIPGEQSLLAFFIAKFTVTKFVTVTKVHGFSLAST